MQKREESQGPKSGRAVKGGSAVPSVSSCETKASAKVAVLVEVRFYFSVDDLDDLQGELLSAKELFLSEERHLVYANNIFGKCFIFQGFYPNLDAFFCARNYDPVCRTLSTTGQF